jgi:hypothetical protein
LEVTATLQISFAEPFAIIITNATIARTKTVATANVAMPNVAFANQEWSC